MLPWGEGRADEADAKYRHSGESLGCEVWGGPQCRECSLYLGISNLTGERNMRSYKSTRCFGGWLLVQTRMPFCDMHLILDPEMPI